MLLARLFTAFELSAVFSVPRANAVFRGSSWTNLLLFMAISKRYLIFRFLMARPRTKCLSVSLFFIIIYVVCSFISFHTRSTYGVFQVPGSFVEQRAKDNRPGVNLLYVTRAGIGGGVEDGFDKQRDANTDENDLNNEARKIPFIGMKDIKINNTEDDNLSNYTVRGLRRKYLFVFRYYEQLGRATSNLLELASLAKYNNRAFVAPFVNDSRMSGLPGGVSHFYRKQEKPGQRNFSPMDAYFDMQDLNFKLKSRGYSSSRSFRDLESHCARRFNIVLHFLFDDQNFKRDTALWYRVTDDEVTALYKQVKRHDGWVDCPGIKRSRLSKQIGFKVSRYVCVDPEVIRSARELEEKVLHGANCVGIVQWRGSGDERAHFPLDQSITQPLRPSDLEFNAHLVQIARNFVQTTFQGEFIGIHVRSERHVERKGANVTRRCFEKLATRVQESRYAINIDNIFLASDLTDYGSDTLKNIAAANDRESLSLFLYKLLKDPATFDPNGILYDNGAIAIVEMNILSMAKRLFTLGGGNFQEWAVALFLKNHDNERKRVHRMCELV